MTFLDCGHAGMSAEHGEDAVASRPVAVAEATRAARAGDGSTGETDMSVTFECGDKNALVAYLHEERAGAARRHFRSPDSMRLVLERDRWSRVDSPPPGGVDTPMPNSDSGCRCPVRSAPMVAGGLLPATARQRSRHFPVLVCRSGWRAARLPHRRWLNQPPPAAVTTTTPTAPPRATTFRLEERLKSEIAQIRTAPSGRSSSPPRRTKKSCRRLKRSWPRARSGSGVSSRSGPSKGKTSKRSDVSIWRPFERQSAVPGCDRQRNPAAARGDRSNQQPHQGFAAGSIGTINLSVMEVAMVRIMTLGMAVMLAG